MNETSLAIWAQSVEPPFRFDCRNMAIMLDSGSDVDDTLEDMVNDLTDTQTVISSWSVVLAEHVPYIYTYIIEPLVFFKPDKQTQHS